MRSTIILLFLCFFSIKLFSINIASREFIFHPQTSIHELEKALTCEVPIESVTYDSDVYIDQDEFNYLMDIQPSAPITPQAVSKGIEYLFKKKKYESIAVTICPENNSLKVHCVITGMWTFKKLTLSGMLINKEYYRQYYSMESGEPFDRIKHDSAIQKIKDAFADEGYHNANVQSSLSYDYESKQVIVVLSLKRNSRYIIEQVQLNIQGEGVVNEANKQAVLTLCNKYLLQRLHHKAYTKIALTRETGFLQKMLTRNGYGSVDIELSEHIDHERAVVILNFTLIVHQKKECVFTGNHFFSHEQLLENIVQFGPSVSLLPSSLIAEEIVHMYHKKGFWKAYITSQEGLERYTFAIHEGPRARVKKVILKNVMIDLPKSAIEFFFSDFIAQDFYDAHLLKASIDNLNEWYLAHGYWNVSLAKQEFVLINESDHEYVLELTVDENQRSYLEVITLQMNKNIDATSALKQFAKKDLHVPFTMQIVEGQRRVILEFLKKSGYKHIDIKPEVIRNGTGIQLVWHIFLGKSSSIFGKTVIVGDTKIPFSYIQRELCYTHGQPWDTDALKNSYLGLKSWNIFQNIHLSPDQVTHNENEKAVIIKLQEDDPYELRLRGGLELQQVAQFYIPEGLTYKLGGSFIVKSPLHRGDCFRIDGDFARVYRELAARYEVPWLLNQPIKTLFMIYSNKYLQPGFVGGEKSIYDAVGQGFLAGFDRKLEHAALGLNIGFEWLKTSIPDRSSKMLEYIDSVARAINFDPRLLNRSVPFLQIEPTIMLDFVDQKLSPSRGSFTLLSLKGMVPLARHEMDAYFVKALAEQSCFFPIKSLVVASRIRAGHIFFKNLKNVMPMERFYLGGANSLRSYDTDFAPPLGFFLDERGKKQYVPQGGQSMLNMNMELRFPLYKRLGAVLFQDIGALSNTKFADFKAKDVLLGTGFGLRVATPVGPLRFDIAWKWAYEPAARSFAWFLTFGQVF